MPDINTHFFLKYNDGNCIIVDDFFLVLVWDLLKGNVLNSYLDTVDNNWFKQRLAKVMLCILSAFVVVTIRLVGLQIIGGAEFRKLSENNSIRLQMIAPSRGSISDRKGKLLVDNRPSFDLSIILKHAEPVEHVVKQLSQYLSLPETDLLSKIKSHKGISPFKPVLLKEDIGRDLLGLIEVHKFDLQGIVVNVKARRQYMYKYGAAHLIGYLGEINLDELKSQKYQGIGSRDLVGKFGVEKKYDHHLRGKRGGRQVEVDVNGQVVRILKQIDAEPGHNIYLTIDHELQIKTENLLANVVGSVVAMDPRTGKILALASSPSFDQNAFGNGLSQEIWHSLVSNPFRPMENKAIQGQYPPASTYKIVTAIAGIEEGIIDTKAKLYCPGFYKFGDRVFRDWKETGHGWVNVETALTESCDVFFYQVGEKLGVDRLAKYAQAFGLGSLSGLNLDREAKGLVPTAAWKKRRTGIKWQRGETLSVAIGQGYNLVTPLQMGVLISMVANGGTRYQPSILKAIESVDGKIIAQHEPKILGRLSIRKHTLSIIRKALWKVVNTKQGTAWIARLKDIDISGKTGTAQVFSRKKTEKKRKEKDIPTRLKSHAWFVAYAPSDQPKIAIAVLVEHGEHGSSTASPIAREMIKTYLLKKESGEPSKAQLSKNEKVTLTRDRTGAEEICSTDGWYNILIGGC